MDYNHGEACNFINQYIQPQQEMTWFKFRNKVRFPIFYMFWSFCYSVWVQTYIILPNITAAFIIITSLLLGIHDRFY